MPVARGGILAHIPVAQFFSALRTLSTAHPLLLVCTFTYVLAFIAWVLFYRFRPLFLLSIANSIRPVIELKLPGDIKLPFDYFILLRVFLYRPRVLDAWIARHLDAVREEFENRETVKDRRIHINNFVLLNGAPIPHVAPTDLQPTFARSRSTLLITGEGGSGKTSWACELARMAMATNPASRLCRSHRMLPVLVDHEMEAGGPTAASFSDLIHGHLRAITRAAEPLSPELFHNLLIHRRILVIVDGLSEFSPTGRSILNPISAGFEANALIVTSRAVERLGDIPRTIIQPQRIQGNRLSAFVDVYLSQKGVRYEFTDEEYFEGCRNLSRMANNQDVTALLAKLYCEQMIALRTASSVLPNSIPELMCNYVAYLSRSIGRPGSRDVLQTAQIVAWCCVRRSFHPGTAKRSKILLALKRWNGDAQQLTYLEEHLRIIQAYGVIQEDVRFSLDPLAEYLAAIFVASRLRSNMTRWRRLLRRVDKVDKSFASYDGFLLALRDCCLAKKSEFGINDAIVDELTNRTHLNLESLKVSQFERRLAALLKLLGSDDTEDRVVAAEFLARMGSDAKDAVRLLVDRVSDVSPSVRRASAEALGHIGVPAEPAIGVLVDALGDPEDMVRGSAARALAAIGPSTITPLIEALRQSDTLRVGSVTALTLLGEPAVEPLADLISGIDPVQVRRAAVTCIRQLGSVAGPATHALIGALGTKDPIRQEAIAAIGAIGPPAGEAAPHLATCLQDREESIVAEAIVALGKLCDSAKGEISALIPFIDSKFRDQAVSALAAIGPAIGTDFPNFVRTLPVRPVSGAPTVLILDDNRDLVHFMERLMADAGWILLCAESLNEAREVSTGRTLTTALLDYMLPDGSGVLFGVELYWRMAEMPVVIMTGTILPAEEEAICEAYGFPVLRKPFLASDIMGLIRNRLMGGAG
jgi:HEAT repeat protein